ncbi:unnamed protein product [Polarella glacialis]|uniref:Uncharacterized protein n=1 Tax=Polarella glacialis TaxID=89957 RepID=A0A813IY26_POLGL|nr:unnamed protein product [Polarella glacialis]
MFGNLHLPNAALGKAAPTWVRHRTAPHSRAALTGLPGPWLEIAPLIDFFAGLVNGTTDRDCTNTWRERVLRLHGLGVTGLCRLLAGHAANNGARRRFRAPRPSPPPILVGARRRSRLPCLQQRHGVVLRGLFDAGLGAGTGARRAPLRGRQGAAHEGMEKQPTCNPSGADGRHHGKFERQCTEDGSARPTDAQPPSGTCSGGEAKAELASQQARSL